MGFEVVLVFRTNKMVTLQFNRLFFLSQKLQTYKGKDENINISKSQGELGIIWTYIWKSIGKSEECGAERRVKMFKALIHYVFKYCRG